MVFKAHHRKAAELFVHLVHIVADHAGLRTHGIEIQRADKVAALSVVGLVIRAQHLVAAANGEDGHAVLYSRHKLFVPAAVQILQQHLLFEVLSAADER